MNRSILGMRWLIRRTGWFDRRGDRGDVPGWVLVTVMSVGIVLAIWGVAQGELTAMLRQALNSVK